MTETITYTDSGRTAADPYEYVEKLIVFQHKYDPTYHAEVISIDGETKSGRKRYTMRVTRKAAR